MTEIWLVVKSNISPFYLIPVSTTEEYLGKF